MVQAKGAGMIPAYLRVGRIFQRDGAYWMVMTVTREHNADFTWLHVTALWSQFGPRPRWADEEYRFLMERKRLQAEVARLALVPAD